MSRRNLKSGWRALFLAVSATSLMLVPAAAQDDPAQASVSPEDWSTLFRADLAMAAEVIARDHPAMFDAYGEDFAARLAMAVADAENRASQIDDPLSYSGAMAAFTAHFGDGHFQMTGTPAFWNYPVEQGGFWWPRIVVGSHGNQFTVRYADPAYGLEVGDELRGCDGVDIETLILERVFAFDTRSPDNPGSWAVLAPSLFVAWRNPFAPFPDTCTFEQNNREIEVELDWERATAQARIERRNATFGETPDVRLAEKEDGIWWINASSFYPRDDDEHDALEGFIATIAEQAEAIRTSRAIVFDLSGNQGGNSRWGMEILNAVYGEDYLRSLDYSDAVYVDWLAREGSIRTMQGYLQAAEERGGSEGSIAFYRRTIDGMQAALDRGEDWYSTQSDEPASPPEPMNSPATAKAYIFANGWCASACLDFMDRALNIEGVQFLGYPTASDSNYMDVRAAPLVSG